MQKIIDWVKANKIIVLVALAAIIFLFGRKIKRVLFGTRRVKHRPGWGLTHSRGGKTIKYRNKSRRSLPRSVGTHKASGKGYPAARGGYIPFKHNKDGSIKKAAFVAGTLAAKHRMSHLRRMK